MKMAHEFGISYFHIIVWDNEHDIDIKGYFTLCSKQAIREIRIRSIVQTFHETSYAYLPMWKITCYETRYVALWYLTEPPCYLTVEYNSVKCNDVFFTLFYVTIVKLCYITLFVVYCFNNFHIVVIIYFDC